jgi:ParB family chromosome partitioning protein
MQAYVPRETREVRMTERRRLGKGLDSLIPELDVDAAQGASPQEIPLKKIEMNPRQPRRDLDPEPLQQLADSIKASGVIQPVIVRPAGDLYELVVGERRVRAAHLAGLETIPALVRDVPDHRMLELALVENIQRTDLNPIEKAQAIQQMISELGLTQEEAGRRLGLDRSTIANFLRLLELSEELQEMVSRGTLSAGHARALLAVNDPAVRVRLARQIAARGLSVREAERLAARPVGALAGPRLHAPSPDVVQMEEALSRALGTRVQIGQMRKGGKIVVYFRNHEDFERLFELVTGHGTADEDLQRVPA